MAFTAWTASTAYNVGDLVRNGDWGYTCVQAGTSAGSGGPSGTGNNQSDGSAKWDYIWTNSNEAAAIKSYLTPSPATDSEDIQA